MATPKFTPQTVTIRETKLYVDGSHPATTIYYFATDTPLGSLDSAQFNIQPITLNPRFANKGCVEVLINELNKTYKPKHPEFYNDLYYGESRFWWRTDHPYTPFASQFCTRKLDGFEEHKHDAVFVEQLCKKLDEEAMNVIEAINALWTTLDQDAVAATPDTLQRL